MNTLQEFREKYPNIADSHYNGRVFGNIEIVEVRRRKRGMDRAYRNGKVVFKTVYEYVVLMRDIKNSELRWTEMAKLSRACSRERTGKLWSTATNVTKLFNHSCILSDENFGLETACPTQTTNVDNDTAAIKKIIARNSPDVDNDIVAIKKIIEVANLTKGNKKLREIAKVLFETI